MSLFFDKDSVNTCLKKVNVHPEVFLIKLIRLIFYRLNITFDDFAEKYKAYGQRINLSKCKIRTRYYSDRNTISSTSGLTMYMFVHILYNVLCLNIVNISVVVVDKTTGQRITYSSDESL